jgi:heat shock protein HslJ
MRHAKRGGPAASLGDDLYVLEEVGKTASSPSGAWLVSAVRREDELAAPLSGTSLTAVFDESGRVFGSAGCNRFTAAYAATDGEVRITEAASTRMFCADPPDVMEQEATFLAALARAVRFRLENGSLQLLDATGGVLVALVRDAAAPSGPPG